MSNNLKEPNIYVVLVNWNGHSNTIECIESLLKSYYVHFQIIVVDNNSDTSSLEIICEWLESKNLESTLISREEIEGGNINNKILFDKKHIVIIKNHRNLGFADANNTGIKYASINRNVDYLWFLNNDTVIDPNAFCEQVRLAQKNRQIGMIASKILSYYNPNTIQEIYGQVLWNDKGKGIGSNEQDVNQWNYDFEIDGRIMGASMFVNVEAIKTTGMMDQKYFMEYEDADWSYQFRKKGWKLYFCSNSKVYHKEGGSIIDDTVNYKKLFSKKVMIEPPNKFLIHSYYGLRNSIYFTRKFFKNKFPLFCITVLPVKIVKYLMQALFNKDYRYSYVKLVFKAVYDGLVENMGKTIDPIDWKNSLNMGENHDN